MDLGSFDVIVIGAGHAGCEAAYIASKLNFKTALITTNIDHIALMPCNPSIGGLGKTHIALEVDALGGLMLKVADKSALYYKTLNKTKGAAAQAKRSQNDRWLYSYFMRQYLSKQKTLHLITANIFKLSVKGKKIIACYDNLGNKYKAKVFIITTGTFMNGLIHIGDKTFKAGRLGDESTTLSDNLKALGFNLIRLKTGTPPRVNKHSIDFNSFEVDEGDKISLSFSMFSNVQYKRSFIKCYIARTNKTTHQLIKDNLKYSALYSGKIIGIGPRYCPSIEDKVVKFTRDSHHIFIEPESTRSNEIYLNGLSMSLPIEIQYKIVRSIKGLENALITRFAYAIEYDAVDPTQIHPTLQTKKYENLFLAGQINGTSGYEEAAGQGILAGINAINYLKSNKFLVLKRSESFIGVMVDDITSKGIDEPYRMFTSRSEFRLSNRCDNVYNRMYKTAIKYSLLTERENEIYINYLEDYYFLKENFYTETITINNKRNKIAYFIKSREIDCNFLINKFNNYNPRSVITAFYDIYYEGYLKKESQQEMMLKKYININLDKITDYSNIPGLSNEIKEKLNKYKPSTLLEASKIPGITPAALIIIIACANKENGK